MGVADKLFAESWNIAFRETPEGTILDNQSQPFRVIKNPARYWAADPFVFKKDEKTYIFAELFDYCTNKGVIGCTQLTDSGITGWRVIIKEPWHLSYPFVFEHNGEIYIMPEMNDGRALWVYKAETFPLVWKKVSVVLDDVKYVDTTLKSEKDGFIAFSQEVDSIPKVFFLNNRLEFEKYGEYEGESGCFVRPGGRFFSRDNRCYAVCQDCSQTYGGALIFFEVETSGKGLKLGKRAKHLRPADIALDSGIVKNGIHTYSATKNYEVIDIKTRRFSLLNLLGRIMLHMRGREHE